MLTFIVHTPVGVNQIEMKRNIYQRSRATKKKISSQFSGFITGENSGDNLRPGTPVNHFEQWESDYIDVRHILKGGGCENKNIQYSLPTELEGLGRGT